MRQPKDSHSPPVPIIPSADDGGKTEQYIPKFPEKYPFANNSFVIEDSFYRSHQQRPVHWSVAWSDLMMTMFILFLSMFVYQASHKEFLVSNTPEIIGGSTTEAIDILGDSDIIVPIVPIVPLTKNGPIISKGTVKKIEKVQVNDLNIDELFNDNIIFVEPAPETDGKEGGAVKPGDTKGKTPSPAAPVESSEVIEPAPLKGSDETLPKTKEPVTFREIYDMSRQVLLDNKLDTFASIEVVPDKTMRIILTGDLLFHTGQADLSNKARKHLRQLTEVIRNSPYMINVIGHTDNQPMHSSRFASNWELSVVRASSVARFLIDEMKMDPAQFVVSGYGSNRPRRPNTNASNRAANRRVEIIMSKRLAPAVQATPKNLL